MFVLASLLLACESGGPTDEEIAKAGKAYPPALLASIENACLSACSKDAATCKRVCSCKKSIVKKQLPYKSYLELQRAGTFELKSTINRMTVGCARA